MILVSQCYVLNAFFIVQKHKLEVWPGYSTTAEVYEGGLLLRLDDGGDPQELLRHCFREGIELESFEHHNPTLHDVFLDLVGEEAKEASYR